MIFNDNDNDKFFIGPGYNGLKIHRKHCKFVIENMKVRDGDAYHIFIVIRSKMNSF